MSRSAIAPTVLLSTLGKLTLNVNPQATGLVRTGVSLRRRGEDRQQVIGGQDHETRIRALAHRDALVEYWVSQGWEIRQPWMDKEAKWSNATARVAPTPENWGPHYTPPAKSAPRQTPAPPPVSAVPAPAPEPRPAQPPTPLRPPDAWPGVEVIVRHAVECRECFDRREVQPPFITVAQPRWVPPGYWQQSPRVAVLMINPGESGDTLGARQFLERMAEYRAGRMDLRTLLDCQRTTMMQWGNPPGRFARFYFNSLGLSVDQVAFANVAWCGTKGNQYPGSMVDRCFHRHTLPLLRALAPHVVIASGSKTHHYVGTLKAELPGVTVEPTLHYAHRGGGAVEAAEVARLRQMLAKNRARTA